MRRTGFMGNSGGITALVLAVSFWSVPVAADEAQEVREHLLDFADSATSIGQQLHSTQMRALASKLRESVNALSDEDAAHLVDVAGGLARLNSAASALDTTLGQGQRTRIGPSTPDFPGITYTLECPEFAGEFDAQVAALAVKNAAEAVLAALQDFCDKFTVPVPIIGGSINFSVACVPLAIIKSIATATYEGIAFCAGDRHSVRLGTGYDESEHLHDDLTTHADNRTTRFNSVDAELLALQADLTRRAAQVDTEHANLKDVLNEEHQAEEDLKLRIEIAQAPGGPPGCGRAARREPAAQGGQIEQVAQLVADLVNRLRILGQDTSHAEARLAQATACLAAADYAGGFEKLRSTYRYLTHGGAR